MEDIRNQSFPSKSIQEWKEKAEQSLKGKTIESFKEKTYENIILKPLYSLEDELPVPEYPGGTDFRRGASVLGYLTDEWRVAQRIPYESSEELIQNLTEAIEKGQSAISFEVSNIITNDNLIHLLNELSSGYPFAINSKGCNVDFLPENKWIRGFVAEDPLSLFALAGSISVSYLQKWTEKVLQAQTKYPNLRTVLVDTIPFHNGGASAVQELGIAIAEGVHYLELLLKTGMSLETAFSKMVFQFAIGSNFFMELAKLRAARLLWSKIAEVYGVSGGAGMEISAETSKFTKTVHDPHVNLLRAGNEAFAAVLGGVQYLHVEPFDCITGPGPFSERIARNVQLILKEETHINSVIDPAGGSWYIENLTNQLAEKAWSFFQEIESFGGILESLKSSWLQREIAFVFEKRIKDIQTRKQSIVGTNVYANLDEHVSVPKQMKDGPAFDMECPLEPIPQLRLAEPFEKLRNRALQLQYTPAVGMICLGELKQYKARLDFMRGFLSPGGIKTIESGPVQTTEQAIQFVSAQHAAHFCFCGTNDQYEAEGLELLKALTGKFPEKSFFLAGVPAHETEWVQAGLKKFIHVKSNCYETLSEILSDLEVTVSEA